MTDTGQAGDTPRADTGARVLVVDDDPGLLRLVTLRLEAAGFEVEAVGDAETALGVLAGTRVDVVVTDLRMPGMDGMELFRRLRGSRSTLPVIILTAHGTIPDAVAATREGAWGFVTKPFESAELVAMVRDAAGLKTEGSRVDADWRRAVISCSRAMENLLSEIELIADSHASVLIRGGSGSGKELIARAVHAASPRAGQPFIAINCAAVPAELLEAELFGHEKGAFTGADQARTGLFVAADGGSLLLDEIGDMPRAFQAKLLRALQEQSVRPVGSNREQKVDVRVLAATHRDLDHAMETGDFREDLYYRLNVVRLDIPDLRDRPEDIPLLAEHFLAGFQADRPPGERIGGFSPEALQCLVEADWPGNVRQLRNVVEQVCAFCRQGPVPADRVRRALRSEGHAMPALAEARDAFERDYLARVLRMTGGNVSQAARLAGRNRTEFYRLLKRHALDPARFKASGPES